jgi:cation transport protein ChaC
LVYHIDPDQIRTELDIVFRRELITSAYCPTWVKVYVPRQAPVNAITFVIDRNHEQYAGTLDDDITIRTIAIASGALGRCSDYLFETTHHLDKLGIPDHRLNFLARGVRQRYRVTANTNA